MIALYKDPLGEHMFDRQNASVGISRSIDVIQARKPSNGAANESTQHENENSEEHHNGTQDNH